MPFLSKLPDDAKLSAVFALKPERYQPLLAFTQDIMRGDSELSAGERELIAGYVSGLNACAYCAGGHQAAAVAFGIDAGLFEALMDDIASAPIDERLKPLLRFVKKLTENPARMVQADADAVLNAGWSEESLSTAVNVAAAFNYFNRLVEGHGLVANEDQFKARGEAHAKMGYVGQYQTK